MAKKYRAILKTKSGEDAIIAKEELTLKEIIEFRKHSLKMRGSNLSNEKCCYFRVIIDAGFEVIEGKYPGLIISEMRIE
jgi:hypothetical protein